MVGNLGTWLGDPPFNSACRLRGVDKFLRYSGTSWDDRVQTYCQGTVLGGLTMDLWSLSHYVLLPVPVLFISLERSRERELVLVFGRETLSFSLFRVHFFHGLTLDVQFPVYGVRCRIGGESLFPRLQLELQ